MTEELTAVTIAAPDVSKLPSLAFASMMALKVVDDATCEIAVEEKRRAAGYRTAVENLFKEPTSAANKVHKFLTGMRAKLIAPAEQAEKHLLSEIGAHDTRKERARLELQAKLQREQDEKAKREAEAKRQAALAEAAPWEVDEVEKAVQAEVSAPRPTVHLAPVQSVDGVSKRNKPISYRVADFKKLVAAVYEGRAPYDCLNANDAFFKYKVKELGDSISDQFPGIEAVRDVNIQVR